MKVGNSEGKSSRVAASNVKTQRNRDVLETAVQDAFYHGVEDIAYLLAYGDADEIRLIAGLPLRKNLAFRYESETRTLLVRYGLAEVQLADLCTPPACVAVYGNSDIFEGGVHDR